MYGPESNQDWGPGIVYAYGIFFVQILPLLVTLPIAFWARNVRKT